MSGSFIELLNGTGRSAKPARQCQGFAAQGLAAQGLAAQGLGAHFFAAHGLAAQFAAAQDAAAHGLASAPVAAWSAMAAPAGASAGLSDCFEQAEVAIVNPPMTTSMEASLDFFMGFSPFVHKAPKF